MAKKKSEISNPEDVWLKKIFTELKGYVFDGDYQAIDNFFVEHIKNDDGLSSKLAQAITQDSYFFSFRVNMTTKETVKDEILNRELAILKNFRIGRQLMLLDFPIENVGYEHIAALNVTEDTKHLLKSTAIINAVTKLLWREDFAELDKIQTLMDFNIFEAKGNIASFCYRESYSHGVSFARLKKKLFSPKFDLIFNFTEEKRQYLLDKNVILPTEEEAKKLNEAMIESMTNHPPDVLSRMDLAFKNYKIKSSYHDLREKITNTSGTQKKNKI